MSTSKCSSSVVLLAAMITGCTVSAEVSRPSEGEIETITLPVRTPFWLNDVELQRAKRLALIGDLPASYCLANHYSYEVDAKDPDRSFWILIAAENGDADAMMGISLIYRKASDVRLRDRAEFWRLRAESTRSQERIDCHASVR